MAKVKLLFETYVGQTSGESEPFDQDNELTNSEQMQALARFYTALLGQAYEDACLLNGWSLHGRTVKEYTSISARRRREMSFPLSPDHFVNQCNTEIMHLACEVVGIRHSHFMKRIRELLSLDLNKAA